MIADEDADRVVVRNEMSVLVVENFPAAMPDISDHAPVDVELTVGLLTVSLQVNLVLAGVGPFTPFYQIAHEVSHAAVGTVDLYNDGAGQVGMTLMSRYSFTSDDQYTVHLDIWHKLALGWAEPRRFDLSHPGSAEIWEGTDGAILLWDEAHGSNEFFLVERRRPDAPGLRYDSGFMGDGAVIWRVHRGPVREIVTLAPPNLTRGGSGVWAAGTQTPKLRWRSLFDVDPPSPMSISVADPGNGRLTVRWGDQIAHVSQRRHHRLFHGGNGSDGVGGLTHRGVFYGVATDGRLTWNAYNGFGAQPDDPAVGPGPQWNANTGNPIGNGFGPMLHMVGCGNGAIMAVHPDGTLRWYQYSGHGEPDSSGGLGWEPNSGNTIGNGWQSMLHLFAIPSSGASGSVIQLLAVNDAGDLLWYGYRGNGEHDPSGAQGWVANSGNQIGNGWRGFRHIHASSNVIFAVANDGTLRWYSYSGRGVHDPSGTTGWDPKSGNPIGRGWQGMQHVFGSYTDAGGFAHVVMGVDAAGDLRWYRYTGQGESDITGVLGWHPRSGSRIGTGW